jgi:hypothetical protein
MTAPGLKRRRNKNGTIRLFWVARGDIVKQGYTPKCVALHYDAADPVQWPLIASACKKLQAEMLEWRAGRRSDRLHYDGTLAALIRCYQHDPASPYAQLKWNTKRTYDHVIGLIEKAFGKRALSALTMSDFRRWYDEARKPKAPGGAERVRKAHGIISMVRRLLAYGIMAEKPECARLAAILDEARFKQPRRRWAKLELHHVEAFVPAAIDAGRVSLALGTALQFETTLRQRDVIGEWAPFAPGESASGIILGDRRWVNGLTWADLADDLVVRKRTTKTGAIVAHDLKLCPLVLGVLEHVPLSARVGPLIIDEKAGRPYAEYVYTRRWRAIARKAGIPNDIWNMDARAGAISEADDAGADLDMIRSTAGHTQSTTTARYIRGTIGKSRTVAKLRQAHRAASKTGREQP